MLKVRDLRRSYVDFFKSKGHRIVHSSSLLPKDDPTLLFTTAGMVQFKAMFAGTVDLEYTRAASIQKCLRTSDLENVGRTKRHLTFFEMLGNFSFGDYFKEEAIEFAWEYSTKIIGFDKEKIWVSIFENDDEAFKIWNEKIGVPKEKIVRLGKKDNFWGPAGDSGACGPCTELYIDRGPTFGCGSKDCKPGCDCERYLEYWNLVFNQYFQDVDGKQFPLPKTGIDTGMGLERLATLIQGVDSVFETDELAGFIEFVCREANVKYEDKNKVPVNVIVEHARALTFAMSDGIYPSNEGRGYVLRRVLRRALRFTRQLGIREPFVFRLVDPIVDTMGEFYPEIKESAKNIKNVIESEEKRFLETIEHGMARLEEITQRLKKSGEKTISGKDAFLLYDTFGFPLEMTVEMAAEIGLNVDSAGFEKEMEDQRERGKSSWKGSAVNEKAFEEMVRKAGESHFRGYELNETAGKILAIHNGKNIVDKISSGEDGFIVISETPFYGESGGQAGDTGEIISGTSRFTVSDTKKINKTTIHIGSVSKGEFKSGETVTARIDVINRNLIRANHTVTHLLQAALRNVLGTHVKQAGSLVENGRMRFDFSHFNAMTTEEIEKIESIVNEKIWENIDVTTKVMALEEAVKSGAMAVFDEKYDDTVRVVSVPGFSMELCGGTHVSNTGSIGLFKILKESSPGAGLRRIEAVTLKGLFERFRYKDQVISEISDRLNGNENDILKRVESLIDENRALTREMEKIKKQNAASGVDSIIASAEEAGGVKIVSNIFDDADADLLRSMADSVREKLQTSVVLFGSKGDGKALLLYAATNSAVSKGIDCGAIIKETAKIVGGGGGGRKDMAQAGGKSADRINEAISAAVEIAKKSVKP